MDISTVKDADRPRRWGRATPRTFRVTRGLRGALAIFTIEAPSGAEASRAADWYQYIVTMATTGRRDELTATEVHMIPSIYGAMVKVDR